MEDWASWEELKANEGSNSASNFACGNWAVRARLALPVLGTHKAAGPALWWHLGTEQLPGSLWEGMAMARTPCLVPASSSTAKGLRESFSPCATRPGFIPAPSQQHFPACKGSRDCWDDLLWIGLLFPLLPRTWYNKSRKMSQAADST